VERIAAHEAICTMRRKLGIREAVAKVLEEDPAVAGNKGQLIRRVWALRDGYFTPEPNRRLTDPWTAIRYVYEMRAREGKETKKVRRKEGEEEGGGGGG